MSIFFFWLTNATLYADGSSGCRLPGLKLLGAYGTEVVRQGADIISPNRASMNLPNLPLKFRRHQLLNDCGAITHVLRERTFGVFR